MKTKDINLLTENLKSLANEVNNIKSNENREIKKEPEKKEEIIPKMILPKKPFLSHQNIKLFSNDLSNTKQIKVDKQFSDINSVDKR